MSNFQVLDSETRCGYITLEEHREIAIRLAEEGAILKNTRTATCRGYISRRNNLLYACSYSGRYGTGVTLRASSDKSSTFCDKVYIIYENITKDRITSIIEEVRQEHAYKLKLKELIPILPLTFLVYDMTHDTIFNVAHYRMLYLPKHAHYLDYHVYLIESSDKHIVINIMED